MFREFNSNPKDVDSEYGLVEWIEVLKNPRDGSQNLRFHLPQNLDFCPDVIFYLKADDDIISYCRLKFRDVAEIDFFIFLC